MTLSVSHNFSATLAGLLVVCAVALSFSGCRRVNQNAAVVNVLRDPGSSFFARQEHLLLSFQARRPATSTGKVILVQSILLSRPRLDAVLANESAFRTLQPDLVILDSPEETKASDTVAHEAANAKNACDNEANCPVFIPSWVTGERLQAAHQVLKALLSGRN